MKTILIWIYKPILKKLLPKFINLVLLTPVLLILQYFLRFKISLFPGLILHILQMELSIPVNKEKHPYPQPREKTSSMFKLPDLSSPHRRFLRVTEPRCTQERTWIRTVPLRIYLKRLVENENLQSLLHSLNPRSRTTELSGRKIFI